MFQPVDADEKLEMGDELDLWVGSAVDYSTNVHAPVTLMEATTLLATSAVALAASLF